ncbi:MAG: hypothetical protein M1829_004418 [Trizodia sp. TS-e1964]|nr:MAG: hypothetical protein M1829_004418 [Trizodia sp. TS-e1964]
MSRPEDRLPPDLYYDARTASQYTTSSRIHSIQRSMTERALSLLALPAPSLILDLGCGSGLSGSLVSRAPPPSGPHHWIGLDISGAMLAVGLARAAADPSSAGDTLLADMGQGLPFRAGMFDAAISISAVQWLCSAEGSAETDEPARRLKCFFEALYRVLKSGARAVIQWYPRDAVQRQMVERAAVRAGFGAGVLEDGAGTREGKVYLVLTVGGGVREDVTSVVRGMDGVDVVDGRRAQRAGRSGKREKERKGGKAWILRKKEQMARKGMVVKSSSKYTGRKRGIKF